MLAAQETLEIRPMTSGDLAALASLFNGGRDALQPPLPASLQEKLAAATYLRLLALRDGSIIGQASLMRDAKPDAARITVLVHPNHRRQGIARALLEELSKAAKKQCALHTLLALVEQDNAPAQRLYLSCGYEDDALKASSGILVFRKELMS